MQSKTVRMFPLFRAHEIQSGYISAIYDRHAFKYANHFTRKPRTADTAQRDMSILFAVFLVLGIICLLAAR